MGVAVTAPASTLLCWTPRSRLTCWMAGQIPRTESSWGVGLPTVQEAEHQFRLKGDPGPITWLLLEGTWTTDTKGYLAFDNDTGAMFFFDMYLA